MFPIRDHNPSRHTPYVTYALIALNVAIYLWTVVAVTTDRQLYDLYYCCAMIPARITAGENYLSLVSSIFLHGGFMHLAGNMLFLWIFGDNLEDEMGHGGFTLFYLACGVAASMAQWAAGPWSPIPTIGASGAIAGVMGGYLLLFPKAKVDILIILIVFFRVIPVPAWIMLGLWFGLQLFNSIGSDAMAGGVAYWAHAGGFVIGVIFALPVWLRRGATQFWSRTDGHPPHPETRYPLARSNVPRVKRSR
ncbi:rhomboid family intramembrane serine protease [Flavimaricola marinus]|uniref:Rhomboid protease GluP n=1 Tax=Flavimaricola marinus TaxID=1819565 RepID=A0A238LL08_9RHOB|nr:rhomboid family intramembrane serine protease [Flavimaricola marinus]SMY10369.1 Rhomboid protease GluP [Flavimaricola marinus]